MSFKMYYTTYYSNLQEKFTKFSYRVNKAVNLARQGGIANVGIAPRNDTEYLKSLPDDTESNNISSLPSIS